MFLLSFGVPARSFDVHFFRHVEVFVTDVVDYIKHTLAVEVFVTDVVDYIKHTLAVEVFVTDVVDYIKHTLAVVRVTRVIYSCLKLIFQQAETLILLFL